MQSRFALRKTVVACSLLALPVLSTSANAAIKIGELSDSLKNTEVTFGGYIKVDAFWSDFSDGKLSSDSVGRQFYIPATVPVCTTEPCDGSSVFDAHARSTRFNFGTKTESDGHTIKTFIELDFLVTPNGNERVSSSYTPRLRHAYVSYDNWLVGQTWTTFQDVAVLPESLDFLGPAESTTFGRQTMIRYTNGNWQFALENPETTITPHGGGARIDADDSVIPDLIVRYNHKDDWGHVSVSGIVRQLKVDSVGVDATDTGYGISVGSKIKFGSDDLKLMVVYGSGLGRYVGTNIANAAAVDALGDLDTITTTSALLAYRHFWSEKWRSTLSYSMLRADNDVVNGGTSANKAVDSVHLNLIYEPTKNMTFGVELINAVREIESGYEGDMNRLQFSAKYAF